MKCIGAASPPCERCSKVGRHCAVPTSNQSRSTSSGTVSTGAAQSQPEPRRFSTVPVLSSSQHVAVTPLVPSSIPHRIGSNYNSDNASSPHPAVLRVPWMSSLPTMHKLPVTSRDSSATPGRSRSYEWTHAAQGSHWDPLNPDPALNTTSSLPNDEEVCHLARYFETNLIEHVPVLTRLDVSDLVTIVKTKRTLVYSMAYIAARFVPGCRAIRNTLGHLVRSMVWLQSDQPDSSDEQRWILLQALAVLYTWAPISHVEAHGDSDIVFTMLKLTTLLETLAVRDSLHNSAEEVMQLLKYDPSNLRQTFAFRKYIYWLWLFSTGYFQSLISQTPPRIREDVTFNMSSQLLQNLIHDDQVREILAPVGLCLLWADAGRHGHDLGQWWCGVPTQVELDSRLSVLNDLDTSLQVWQQRWTRCTTSRPESTSTTGRNYSIDICYYYTRFCISIYVTRLYQSSASAEAHTMSIFNLTTQSIARAMSLFNLLLKLTPHARSSMAFSPELTFAMIASCCDYMVYLYDYSADLDLLQPGQVTAMAEVVELMIDLGVDDRHSAKVYGRSIMARLQEARAGNPWQRLPESSNQKTGNTWSVDTGPYRVLSSQQ
jgi:hypothetical protein